jgi:hypothetical protein
VRDVRQEVRAERLNDRSILLASMLVRRAGEARTCEAQVPVLRKRVSATRRQEQVLQPRMRSPLQNHSASGRGLRELREKVRDSLVAHPVLLSGMRGETAGTPCEAWITSSRSRRIRRGQNRSRMATRAANRHGEETRSSTATGRERTSQERQARRQSPKQLGVVEDQATERSSRGRLSLPRMPMLRVKIYAI